VKISIIGVGYVGLVTGACLSNLGFDVICADIHEEKINQLKNNISPIYEPDLDDVIKTNTSNNRLTFTTDMKKAVEESNVIFIAVGTPQKEDGSANLEYIEGVAKNIGKYINRYKTIVIKSTVPVGTGNKVKKIIEEYISDINMKDKFDIVSNPEFLRQGSAIYDFNNPERIVIGTETEKAKSVLKEVYKSFYERGTNIIETNIETSELIKYASNAFLAMKISYINEIANLCEKVNANILDLAKALGADKRISPEFLSPGPGYGGSCFPKDTLALVDIATKNEIDLRLVKATIEVNNSQKINVVKKISKILGNLNDKYIGILGLSFKPNTDDMREAPSVTIINMLYKLGAKLKVYDPIAMENAKKIFTNMQDSIQYCEDKLDVVKDIDALIIITEWDDFKILNLKTVKKLMRGNIICDLRNIYNKKDIEDMGFKYYGTGV